MDILVTNADGTLAKGARHEFDFRRRDHSRDHARQASRQLARKLLENAGAGRAGTPEEFASACACLCGTGAAFITDQNLMVDGGLAPITVQQDGAS